MNELEQKYKANNLSAEELKTLKDFVNSMSDEQLAARLFDDWMNDEIDTSSVKYGQMHKLKTKIDRSIDRPRDRFTNIRKIGQIAAVVLLPVFIITTFYFYKENRQLTSEEMVVTTSDNERATIALPDGTSVALNSNSRLAYTPKVYNKDIRQITFDGEGYFQVHKDADRPFLINAKGLKVKVLGTVFNLQVHNNSSRAELALEQGRVQFTSTKVSKNVILYKGDKAILEQTTGKITVIKEKNINNSAAWKRGYLSFHETALSEIIKNIEISYRVNISIEHKAFNDSTDLFSGTIPVTNLNEALLILQKSYHLNCNQNGKNIILSR